MNINSSYFISAVLFNIFFIKHSRCFAGNFARRIDKTARSKTQTHRRLFRTIYPQQSICYIKKSNSHTYHHLFQKHTLFAGINMDETHQASLQDPRRSTRKKISVQTPFENASESISASSSPNKSKSPKKVAKTKTVKRKVAKRKVTESASDSESSISSPKSSPKKRIVKKKVKKTKVLKATSKKIEGADGAVSDDAIKSKTKKVATKTVKRKATKTKVEPQRITEQDEITKLWDAEEAMEKDGSYTFKILSWNVAGLRGLLKKQPNALAELATKHSLDMICLQETKLQEMHLTDPKLKIKDILVEEGYESIYSCSTVKKGYSGTAVYMKIRQSVVDDDKSKKKQAKLSTFFAAKKADEESKSPASTGDIDITDIISTSNSCTIGNTHDGEGRIIAVFFPHFFIVNCYVPNSGQKLERLDYRTEQWDKDLIKFMREKEKELKVPGIWLGDLNVAHKAYDVWNDGAKHLSKQAGVTQQERDSFQNQLDTDGGAYIDVFRHLFPDAKGHYSYWSQRAGNREPNKGLRLDYFIASKDFFSDEKQSKVRVRDSYMIKEQESSDHCPVVLEIEVRK